MPWSCATCGPSARRAPRTSGPGRGSPACARSSSACGPRLRTFTDDAGRELLDIEDGAIADPDRPAPVRFLPQYDNVFLSHDDRSRINGALSWGLDFVWKGPILVDGGISGSWRVRRTGASAAMTIELGRVLSAAERRDLEAEAERLGAFLDPEATREIVVGPG